MEKKIPWEGERPREPQVREGERPREPQIVFAERGKEAEYAIVIPAEAGASVRYAAEELRDYVRRMTGVELPIVGEGVGDVATRKAVYLRDDGGRAGRPRPAVMARPEAAPYQEDSFRIKVEGGNLYVIGGKRGVLYGVYELLETYGGVGWFSSWRTVVPKRESFAVPADLDDAQSPAFAMRSTSSTTRLILKPRTSCSSSRSIDHLQPKSSSAADSLRQDFVQTSPVARPQPSNISL